jgi:hypothetical protein
MLIMFMQVLSQIPSWVFALFFVLVAFGFSQSRERVMSRTRVSALPVVMLILSFLGVVSQHGEPLFAFLAWGAGLCLAVSLALRWMDQSRVRFFPERNEFRVPGSWLPLALMMGIFLSKTMVGITSAVNPVLATSVAFALATGLVYGMFSGLFLARGLTILRARHVHNNYDFEAA